MNSMIKNTLILTVITIIAGFLLGTVYQVTKEPIAASELRAKNEAFMEVMKDASTFEEVEFNEYDAKTELENAGFTGNADITGLNEAKDDSGNTLGYIVSVQSHEGYGGNIDLTVGILSDGTVSGVAITSISETAGLGMRANTEEFKSQFSNKKVDMFEYSKSGATADNQIDALSGATITTNAVTNAVNAAIIFSKTMKGGA